MSSDYYLTSVVIIKMCMDTYREWMYLSSRTMQIEYLIFLRVVVVKGNFKPHISLTH